MANRYWVGGTANWDNVAGTKWALTDGGAGGQAVPTTSDDVFFTAASGAVTVTSAVAPPGAGNLSFAGFTGTFAGSLTINITGSLTMGSGMTNSYTGSFNITTTGSSTLTSNGISFGGTVACLGAGSVTLADDLVLTGANTTSLSVANGTFNANNKNITIPGFRSEGSVARTINMGSGTWTVNKNSTVFMWSISGTNVTINPSSSTIKFTALLTGNVTFAGLGKTYNNIWIATTGAFFMTITGSNSFADFKIDDGRTIKFTDGTTQTITSLTAVGTAGSGITMTGTSTAGWTITDTSGTNIVSYCTISYSTANGGAVWDASDGTNTNGGGNSGWIFISTRNGAFFQFIG